MSELAGLMAGQDGFAAEAEALMDPLRKSPRSTNPSRMAFRAFERDERFRHSTPGVPGALRNHSPGEPANHHFLVAHLQDIALGQPVVLPSW